MSEYVSTKKDEAVEATVENLLANIDSPKFKEAEKTLIKRLRGRKFIQLAEYKIAQTLEAKL